MFSERLLIFLSLWAIVFLNHAKNLQFRSVLCVSGRWIEVEWNSWCSELATARPPENSGSISGMGKRIFSFSKRQEQILSSHKLLSINYFGDHFLRDNATGPKADHASHLVQSFKMSGEILTLLRIPLYCARVRIYHLQKDKKEQAI